MHKILKSAREYLGLSIDAVQRITGLDIESIEQGLPLNQDDIKKLEIVYGIDLAKEKDYQINQTIDLDNLSPHDKKEVSDLIKYMKEV